MPEGQPSPLIVMAAQITDRIPLPVFERLFRRMSPEKQQRCQRFRRIEDAERLLVADILVRYYFCAELNRCNRELRFDTNAFHKPFLANDPTRHFNVSHSGEWVAAGFAAKPIGIDIQRIKPIRLDIAQRYFTSAEHQDLQQLEAEERTSLFYDLWTLKESYLKALGQGLSLGLNTISFRLSAQRKVSHSPHAAAVLFKLIDLDPGYKFAVCVCGEASHGSVPYPTDISLFIFPDIRFFDTPDIFRD